MKGSISKTGKGCERPYVIEMDQNRYIALGEAALVDNARMKFDRADKDSLLLLTALDGKAVYSSSFSTPWRYVMIADSPGKLLENNYFVLNLNAPNALKDVSWIKPGKVIREVTLTTFGGKACIDFAAKHNLQYIEFDAGWYGTETNSASDATAVKLDPARSPGPLALREVINYGRSKNVGVILYVNQKALDKQLDAILPLYQSWGVKGIKYGFVNVGSHVSQMGKTICIYSPWQFIYWYDRPEDFPRQKGGAGSSASVLAEIPDLTFYDALPAVWEDTKVLESKIGEYATIARKCGHKWFISTLTDKPHSLNLLLGFLDQKNKYLVTIYADDAQSVTPTHIKISKQSVTSASKL